MKQETPEGVEEYFKTGSLTQASKSTGIPRSTIWSRVRKFKKDNNIGEKPIALGDVAVKEMKTLAPAKGKAKTFILTSCQNNTYVHENLWRNIQVFANRFDAEILVSRFSYNKNGFHQPKDSDDFWYDPKISDYVCDENVILGRRIEKNYGGIYFGGEANTLPTAKRPLSGYETHFGSNSVIYPHAKIAMESVPTAKGERTKFMYTTGTVSLRNYIRKKAGLVAEHHHCYGFLVCVVNEDMTWEVRQVNATDDGNFQDLDVVVENGVLTEDNRVEAIVWGDAHFPHVNKNYLYRMWHQDGSLCDMLRPKYQILHDVFDGRKCSRFNKEKPLDRYILSHFSLNSELEDCMMMLAQTCKDYSETIVVRSNHDDRFEAWLDNHDPRGENVKDNLLYFQANAYRYHYAAHCETKPNMIKWFYENQHYSQSCKIKFLDYDESLVICDVEHGLHGHKGANGSKGTPRGLSKVAHKATTGHTHSACIIDGLYVAGTLEENHGYNQGPSSWSRSNVILYPNGKRTILTDRYL